MYLIVYEYVHIEKLFFASVFFMPGHRAPLPCVCATLAASLGAAAQVETSTSCRTLSNIAQGQLATVAEGETESSSAINQTIYVTQGGLTANCFTPLQFWKRRAAMRMKAPKLLYIRPSNLRNLTIRRSRHGLHWAKPAIQQEID